MPRSGYGYAMGIRGTATVIRAGPYGPEKSEAAELGRTGGGRPAGTQVGRGPTQLLPVAPRPRGWQISPPSYQISGRRKYRRFRSRHRRRHCVAQADPKRRLLAPLRPPSTPRAASNPSPSQASNEVQKEQSQSKLTPRATSKMSHAPSRTYSGSTTATAPRSPWLRRRPRRAKARDDRMTGAPILQACRLGAAPPCWLQSCQSCSVWHDPNGL
jgi:hypothetical protein